MSTSSRSGVEGRGTPIYRSVQEVFHPHWYLEKKRNVCPVIITPTRKEVVLGMELICILRNTVKSPPGF